MKKKNLNVFFDEALRIILDAVDPLACETVSILEASKRVLCDDIISDIVLPPADDSAMDGYAIIADDTRGASKSNPVRLEIAGEIKAGSSAKDKNVSKGMAIRIMTGAPIPEGADSVIRFEDTEEETGYIKIFGEVARYSNYRFAGENIRKGDVLLHKGNRLKSADVGILASLNRKIVSVYRQPSVSIISSGDEIADIGEKAKAGQIRNANAYTLVSEIKKYSGIPEYLGIAKDTLKDTKEIFQRALRSDVVISTGGISTGKYDFIKDIYSDLGIEIYFEKVNVKPGSPFTFGKKDNQLFFGLPGNPVPTITSFIQFVRPALLRLMGAKRIHKPIVNAFVEEDINSVKAYHILRGFFSIKDNELYVSKTSHQKPSMLRSMSVANCLIIIPENIMKVNAGEKVAIQLIDHDEV